MKHFQLGSFLFRNYLLVNYTLQLQGLFGLGEQLNHFLQ
jgi:hypothetical protein